MLRRVLVCLDERPSGQLSLDSGLRFAQGYGASLTGLMVREPPVVPVLMAGDALIPPVVTAGSVRLLDEILRDHEVRQDQREERLVHMFREACAKRGLTGAWRVVSGEPAREIPRAARAFDLVVVGRGDRPDEMVGSVAGALVRDLAHPVLLAAGELPSVSTIAVAYDGSHGADRALALAADVAFQWRGTDLSVVLIGVGPAGGGVREALTDAERYLGAYHLSHRTHVLDGPPAELLVRTAEAEKADLLVMGAYGHSRVRELLLGSTTQEVIDRWKGALLLWR